MKTNKPVFVGVNELAKYTGASKQTIGNWRKRGFLPEPYQQLACGPIWEEETIKEFFRNKPSPEEIRRRNQVKKLRAKLAELEK